MENPNFRLEGIIHEKDELQDFEGPLSLILMLLQKNKIEIRDLKISEILDQYLAWMAQMQSMDLEIASEFVQMASHLLYIKTRTLLTAEEEVSELEVLMESLEQLKAKDNLAAIREVVPELMDLLKALRAVFSRGVKVPEEEETLATAIPRRIVYSVRSKSRELLERLRSGPATLEELYRGCGTRSEVVATFLSVLELCSVGSVHIDREETGYRLSFTGGDVDEILEKIEE